MRIDQGLLEQSYGIQKDFIEDTVSKMNSEVSRGVACEETPKVSILGMKSSLKVKEIRVHNRNSEFSVCPDTEKEREN